MLKVEYRLKVGRDEFVLTTEVKGEREFFEQMSFYSNLPRTAPGGADDLRLVFRTTRKGHKYYSLVSPSEKLEFKFGQNLDTNGGGLFPKGWETLYEGKDDDAQDSAPAPTQNAAQVQAQLQGQTAPQPAAKTTQVTPASVAAQPTNPTPAPQPQVTKAANDVLARFGIQQR